MKNIDKIQRQHILIDTCFILNYMNADRDNCAHDYQKLISHLKKKENIFTTVPSVSIEYLKYITTLDQFKQKKDFIDGLIEYVLPLDKNILDDARLMTILYRQSGKDVSANDFILAATLKKYYKHILLLTCDHKGFPTTIFDRELILTMDKGDSGIDTYSLLRFSPAKAEIILNKLLEIENKKNSAK